MYFVLDFREERETTTTRGGKGRKKKHRRGRKSLRTADTLLAGRASVPIRTGVGYRRETRTRYLTEGNHYSSDEDSCRCFSGNKRSFAASLKKRDQLKQ